MPGFGFAAYKTSCFMFVNRAYAEPEEGPPVPADREAAEKGPPNLTEDLCYVRIELTKI